MAKAPLTERQLDKRNENVPALDPEDIQEAHTGERVTLVNLGHHNLGGYDYDGRRFNVLPGRTVSLTKRRADELLKSERGPDGTTGKFEVYDPKKHDRKKEAAEE